MRSMCASVLVFEAIVLGLSTPVMITIADVDTTAALVVGLGLTLAALVVAGLLRYRWAYVAGSLVQVAAVGLGFVVPEMFVLGLIFAAFWVLAIVLGRRIQALQRERAAAGG
jgi:hypothetical protein